MISTREKPRRDFGISISADRWARALPATAEHRVKPPDFSLLSEFSVPQGCNLDENSFREQPRKRPWNRSFQVRTEQSYATLMFRPYIDGNTRL
jgi:hypothetical protein